MQYPVHGRHLAAIALVLGCTPLYTFPPGPPPERLSAHPRAEVLHYKVEWRLIHAGNGKLTWTPNNSQGKPSASATLHLESAGLVNKLYKVNDDYAAQIRDEFCTASTHTLAHEGSRRRETNVTFDSAAKKATYLERDLVKNTVVSTKEIEIPVCVHDVVAGLYRLRAMRLEPGQSTSMPISDGKKSVDGKIQAQEREQVRIGNRTYRTIRYEVLLFNDVLYRRKGRLFVWLSDDERRLPVQIRVRLQFHIGTITLQLEKEETT
jgi:hypothetical protein